MSHHKPREPSTSETSSQVEFSEGSSLGTGSSTQPADKRSLSHYFNLIKFDETKRKKLLSRLDLCVSKARNMIDLSDVKKGLQELVVQNIAAHNKTLEPESDDDGLTLSQCLAEINKPESHGDDASQHSMDEPPSVNSDQDLEPVQASHNDEDQVANPLPEDDDAKNNDEFHPTRVKIEPVTETFDTDTVSGFNVQVKSEMTADENCKRGQITPNNTKRNKTPKRSRRSSLKPTSNHKITDYFSKSKYGTPTTFKSKVGKIDSAFVLSALVGDPNRCIVCEKNFKCNYIKTHLKEQHGISRDSNNHTVKAEKVRDDLNIDPVVSSQI